MKTLDIVSRDERYNLIKYYQGLTFSKITLQELGTILEELHEQTMNNSILLTKILMAAVKTNAAQRIIHPPLHALCELPATQACEMLYQQYHQQQNLDELFTTDCCQLIINHNHPILIRNGLNILHTAGMLNLRSFNQLLLILPARLATFIDTLKLISPILNQDTYELTYECNVLDDLHLALRDFLKTSALTQLHFMITVQHVKPSYASAVLCLLDSNRLANPALFNFVMKCVAILTPNKLFDKEHLKEEKLIIDMLRLFSLKGENCGVYMELLFNYIEQINEDKLSTLQRMNEAVQILCKPNILTHNLFQIILSSLQPRYQARLCQILYPEELRDHRVLEYIQNALYTWDIPRADVSDALMIEQLLASILKNLVAENILNQVGEALIQRFKKQGENQTLIGLKSLNTHIQQLHNEQALTSVSGTILITHFDPRYATRLILILRTNAVLTTEHFMHAEGCITQWNMQTKDLKVEQVLASLYQCLTPTWGFSPEYRDVITSQCRQQEKTIMIERLQQLTQALQSLKGTKLLTEEPYVMDTLHSDDPNSLVDMINLLYQVDELTDTVYESIKLCRKKNQLLKAMTLLHTNDLLTADKTLLMIRFDYFEYMSCLMLMLHRVEINPIEHLERLLTCLNEWRCSKSTSLKELDLEQELVKTYWLFYKHNLDITGFNFSVCLQESKSSLAKLKSFNQAAHQLSEAGQFIPIHINHIIQSAHRVYTAELILLLHQGHIFSTKHLVLIMQILNQWQPKHQLQVSAGLDLYLELSLGREVVQIFQIIQLNQHNCSSHHLECNEKSPDANIEPKLGDPSSQAAGNDVRVVTSQPHLDDELVRHLLNFWQKNAAHTRQGLIQLKTALSILHQAELLNASNLENIMKHASIVLFFLADKAFWSHISPDKLTQEHLNCIFNYCATSNDLRSKKQTMTLLNVKQYLSIEPNNLSAQKADDLIDNESEFARTMHAETNDVDLHLLPRNPSSDHWVNSQTLFPRLTSSDSTDGEDPRIKSGSLSIQATDMLTQDKRTFEGGTHSESSPLPRPPSPDHWVYSQTQFMSPMSNNLDESEIHAGMSNEQELCLNDDQDTCSIYDCYARL